MTEADGGKVKAMGAGCIQSGSESIIDTSRV